jgi:hypothetical protein
MIAGLRVGDEPGEAWALRRLLERAQRPAFQVMVVEGSCDLFDDSELRLPVGVRRQVRSTE